MTSAGPNWAVLLDAEHTATTARLAALDSDFAQMVAASADSNADDEHDPEGSTIAFERSQLGTLRDQALQHLLEIDAARGRLAEGRFGVCESCRLPISPDRLAARPVARTCLDCAQRRR